MAITITEALAEVKTIEKKLTKKRENVMNFLYRQGTFTDPLSADGGSRKFVTEEQQSINDLEERRVKIRLAIADANRATELKVGDATRTIAGWLTWRKEVAPARKKYLDDIRTRLLQVRREAQAKGLVVSAGDSQNRDEIVVNLSEKQVTQESERIDEILSVLDGQLSLKNATTTIEI